MGDIYNLRRGYSPEMFIRDVISICDDHLGYDCPSGMSIRYVHLECKMHLGHLPGRSIWDMDINWRFSSAMSVWDVYLGC